MADETTTPGAQGVDPVTAVGGTTAPVTDNAATSTETAQTSAPTSAPSLVPFLLSAATSIAAEEGITEESAALARANAIFEDANHPSGPGTDAGKACLARAKDIQAVQKTGTATDKPQFDYDALRNETTMPAISEIIKLMGTVADGLPIRSKTTPEQEKASEDAYEKLTMGAFGILDAHSIGMSEYKYVFDSLKAIISAMDEFMMQQIVGNRHEIMSRSFGSKNPGTGKFDANYATYGILKATLETVRAATGGKLEDYFNIASSDGGDK